MTDSDPGNVLGKSSPNLTEDPQFELGYTFPPSPYVWAELREATDTGLVRRGILYAAVRGTDNGVMPIGAGTSELQLTLDGYLKEATARPDYPGGQGVMDAWQDYSGPNKPWQLGPAHRSPSRERMIADASRLAAEARG